MQSYIEVIKESVAWFPVLVGIICVPLLIYAYRKYGGLTVWRGLILYSFVFYLLTAFFLIIMPLPDIQEVLEMTGPTMQLRPFEFVRDFLMETKLVWNEPSTYLPALKQGYVFQPVFNIILTIPFGVYLRYYFKQSLGRVVLWSFLLSLFFEITQLSGIYGIYPRPYRLFDIDDLMLNTLGGAVGFGMTQLFLPILPSAQFMTEKDQAHLKTVTLTRRLLAFGFDWLIVLFGTAIITVLISLVFGEIEYTYVQIGCMISYFILLCYWLKGETIGKKIVKIKLVGDDNQKPIFWQLALRYTILYIIYPFVFGQLLQLAEWILVNDNLLIQYIGVALFAILVGGLPLYILYKLFFGRHLFLYEKWSHTHHVTTNKV